MKKIITLMTMLLLLSSFAVAQSPESPAPVTIWVTVNDHPVDDVEVEAENVNYGVTLTSSDVSTLKTERGRATFDMSAFEVEQFLLGHTTVRLTVIWDNVVHVESFQITTLDPNKNTFYFRILDENYIPPVPEPEPEPPVDEPTDEDNLLALLLGLGGLAGGGVVAWFAAQKWGRLGEEKLLKELDKLMSDRTAFKITKFNGKMKLTHLHPGRTSYHSPDIEHRSESAKHEKGKLFV